MQWNRDLADLALGVAGDEKDVIAFPQNQSSSSSKRRTVMRSGTTVTIGPPFSFPNARFRG
jgi:hypothetical protein